MISSVAANCRVVVDDMDDRFMVFVTLRTGKQIAFMSRIAEMRWRT